jgi:5'-methylthioadenosine phosphorylase
MRVFAANLTRLRSLLLAAIDNLPDDRTCPCPAALDGIKLPIELP